MRFVAVHRADRIGRRLPPHPNPCWCTRAWNCHSAPPPQYTASILRGSSSARYGRENRLFRRTLYPRPTPTAHIRTGESRLQMLIIRLVIYSSHFIKYVPTLSCLSHITRTLSRICPTWDIVLVLLFPLLCTPCPSRVDDGADHQRASLIDVRSSAASLSACFNSTHDSPHRRIHLVPSSNLFDPTRYLY